MKVGGWRVMLPAKRGRFESSCFQKSNNLVTVKAGIIFNVKGKATRRDWLLPVILGV
jgi:hypothetical protein